MNTRLPILALMLFGSASAVAQEGSSPLQPLYECRDLVDDSTRLACLDSAVDTLRASETSGDVVTVSRGELEAAEEATFGLSIPNFGIPGLPNVSLPSFSGNESADIQQAAESPADSTRVVTRDDNGQIDRISGLSVASLEEDVNGRKVITLQNGQVWRQTDDTHVASYRRRPATELTVAIRNTFMSSHMMQLNETGRWFRVRRVQ